MRVEHRSVLCGLHVISIRVKHTFDIDTNIKLSVTDANERPTRWVETCVSTLAVASGQYCLSANELNLCTGSTHGLPPRPSP